MLQQDSKTLHIVVLPWLAFGHMIPYLELSKSLASKGHHISYISTPRNLQRLQPKIPQHLSPLIKLVSIPLPQNETLPPGAEATTDLGSVVDPEVLKAAFDGLQQPIVSYLESTVTSRPVDWIIYDFACYWIPPIADRLGIKKVFFSIYFSRSLSMMGDSVNRTGPLDWTKPLPWIPFDNSTVYFRPHEAKKFFSAYEEIASGVTVAFRLRACIDGCDVIAVRSCMELEGPYIELVGKLNKKVVIPVGLMPVSLEQGQGDETWQSIRGWLEKHKQGSVVYVSQGSEFELSQEELTELALGLELSKLPFFWALRQLATDGSSVQLPIGFEERTRERGMVWTKWAPQERILAHGSVGGLLTHCGWSSIIEALQFGKPLIMLPLAIDHGLYARFMVELKVGIEIPRDEEDGSFTGNSVSETLILVLQDGKVYKDEANKLSKIVADLCLQEQYIDKFVQYLQSPM